ncbi:uncharacterized protein ISCGN_024570 [Ixodes scapularis]
MAAEGLPSGQAATPTEMEQDSTGMSSSSSTISYYESISDDQDMNSEPYQMVLGRKRRKPSTSSDCSSKTVKTMTQAHPRLTVIIKPKDPVSMIATINPMKITEKLEMTAPDGVILVRPNRRLNVLAIDTRNTEATKALLGLTSLGGIPVIAYEPLPRELAAGVIYQVPADITEAELQSAVRATAPVISISRLGKSESVKVVFSTDTLPEYVTVGYTRFKLQPYIEKPRQCWKCGRFGHVQTACTNDVRCTRCGGAHDRMKCEAADLLCTNCGKAHDSTSHLCPVYQREKKIYQYKSEAKVGYTTAKAALLSSKEKVSQGRSKTDGTKTKQDLGAHQLLQEGIQDPQPSSSTQLSNARQIQTHVKPRDAQVSTLELKNENEFPRLPNSASKSDVEVKENRQPRQDKSKAPAKDQPSITGDKLQTIVNVIRSILCTWESPLSQALLTVIDAILPLIKLWCR